MDGDGDGISGDDVSSTATDEAAVPRIAADPEAPPHPNAPPPPTAGPTESEAAFLRQFAHLYSHMMLSRVPPLVGPNTEGRDDGVPPTATMGPTEREAAFQRIFAPCRLLRYYEHVVLSQVTLDDGPSPTTTNTGRNIPVLQLQLGARGGGDADDVANADAGAEEEDDDDDDGDDDVFGGFSIGGVVPACGVAIACLPETTVGEGKERGECAVCLEAYEAGEALRTMPCAHGFHERCIFKWLSASRLCPLCRYKMPAEDEDTDTDRRHGHR